VKFGWCLVVEGTPHVGCIRKFRSSMNGKTYECECPCHTVNDKALEELI